MYQTSFEINTQGRGTYNISHAVSDAVSESNVDNGLCHIFIHHTSASLILCENADSDVRKDLETFMLNLVPDGDAMFSHIAEGPDDMPAHIRSILTQSDLTIPVTDNQIALGIWQGIYLWEHRQSSHKRQITVTISG